jgi:DNA polymerase-3 subunit delta'
MWQKIQGHDTIVERFRRAFDRGRLAGSFLFIGPSGIGKRRFAFALAMGLLCKKHDNLNPCGVCDSCKLFGGRSSTDFDFETDAFISPHPDLYYIAKPPDKSFLPMELLVGDKEHRGRAGLCYNISRTPFLGNRKVAILNDADFFNAEGANSLLKTLEEPPTDAVLILLGTSTAKQLPTIRSRCQIVRFSPLPPEVLSAILVEKGIVTSSAQGEKWAVQAEGSLDQAKELADGDVDTLRTELTKYLTDSHWDSVAFAAKLNGLVEALGKDAPLRRQRVRLMFGLAVDHFRNAIRNETVANDSRQAARRLERTLDALEHVDRNANLPMVGEAWSAALGNEC